MSDYEKGFYSNTSSAYFQSGSQAWAGAEEAERIRARQAEWDRQAQQARDRQTQQLNEQNRRADNDRRAADATRRQANESYTRNYTTTTYPHSYITSQHTGSSSDAGKVLGWIVVASVIVVAAFGIHHVMKLPISSGPAVVSNAPQLNLRNCPAANCGIITILNKGDKVLVTQAYDNGWNAVTVRYADGNVFRGFVNGDYLSRM